MNIVELFANIGLKADTAQAERFLGTTKAIQSGLVAAGAAATGFMVVLNKITREATAAALEFQKFETDTGGSAQALQRWQAVAEQTSGAGAAVAASIRAISLNQEKIKMGQGNLSGYQLLGIDPTSDPFEVLEALRTKTTGLSQAMKRNIMAQFGISTDLLATVDLTSEAFDRLAGKAFVIDPGTIAQINKARAAGTELAQAISYIKAKITANLAPAMVELSGAASEFIRLNKDEIMGAVKKIFEWIVRFSQAIGNAAMMINKIIQGTIGWGNALKIIIGLVALLNAAFLTSPLGLFISGIVLLIALLDDIMVYQSGKGRSLIGVLFEKFPEMEEKAKSVGAAFKDILTTIKAIFGDKDSMDEILDKWGAWGDVVKFLADTFAILKDLVVGTFAAVGAGLETLGGESETDTGGFSFKKFFSDFLEKAKERKRAAMEGTINAAERILFPTGRTAPAGAGPTTIQNNITVNGSRDPAATGAAVESAVTGAMRRAEQRLGRTESR